MINIFPFINNKDKNKTITSILSKNKSDKIVLGQTARFNKYFLKYITDTTPETLFTFQIFTLSGFFIDIFKKNTVNILLNNNFIRHYSDINKVVLIEDPELSLYLLYEIILDLYNNKELKYFYKYFKKKKDLSFENVEGIIRSILNFIIHIKENKLDDLLIKKAILDEYGNVINYKIEDFIRIKDEYKTFFEDKFLLDISDRLILTSDYLTRSKIDLPEIILDEICFLKQYEEDFILQNINKYNINILLPSNVYDFLYKNISVDTKKFKSKIPVFVKNNPSLVLYYNFLNRFSDISLREKLNYDKESGVYVADVFNKKNSSIQQKLIIRKSITRDNEIKNIIKYIKKELLKNKNVKPADFYILFPNIKPYSPLISRYCEEYGVPYTIARGQPLNSVPLSFFIKKIIEIPIDWNWSIITDFFSSTYFNHYLESDTEENINKKIGLFIKTDVLIEYDNIKIDKNDLYKYITDKSEFKFNIKILDNIIRRANIILNTDSIEKYYKVILKYFKITISNIIEQDEIISPDKLDEYKAEIFDCIIQLSLLDKYLDFFRQIKSCSDNVEIINSIILYLNKCIKPEEINNNKFSLIYKKLTGILNSLLIHFNQRELFNFNFNIKSTNIEEIHYLFIKYLNSVSILDNKTEQAVQISEMLELRGLTFNNLIIGGLCSKDFPLTSQIDFLIPEKMYNRELKIINHLDESKFLFNTAILNSKNILLSFPMSDGEKELERSPFIEDLIGLYSFENEVDLFSEIFSNNEIFSEFELLEDLGNSINSNCYKDKLKDIFYHFNADEKKILIDNLVNKINFIDNRNISVHDGLVDNFKNLDNKTIVSDRTIYSISKLEEYTKCPQHFFYNRILKLNELPELEDDTDKIKFGLLTHKILEKFHKQIKKQKIKKDYNEYTAVMEQIIDSEIAFENIDMFNIEEQILYKSLVYGIKDKNKYPGILKSYLNFLFYNKDYINSIEPEEFEYSFGTYKKPFKINIADICINLIGKIDRIDKNYRDNKLDSFSVIDYKTGRLPTGKDIKRGKSLQLPIYIYSQIDKEKGVSGQYISLNPYNKVELKVPIKKNEYNTAAEKIYSQLELSKYYIFLITNDIKSGIFISDSINGNCSYCSFKTICGANYFKTKYIEQNRNYYSLLKNYNIYKEINDIKKTIRNKLTEYIEKKITNRNKRFFYGTINKAKMKISELQNKKYYRKEFDLLKNRIIEDLEYNIKELENKLTKFEN